MMTSAIKQLFVILFCSVHLSAFSQTDWFESEVSQECISLIYRFDLDGAEQMLLDQNAEFKESEQLFLESNLLWWQLLLECENDGVAEEFESTLDSAEEHLEEAIGISNSQRQFMGLLIETYRTRFELINDNYVSAVSHLNGCMSDISSTFGMEDSYKPYYLTSGAYSYFAAKAYDDYPLLRPYLFFFPDGDRDKGLAYLTLCTFSDNIYLSTEANYFLMRIYIDMEEDYSTAETYLSALLDAFPENPLYRLHAVKLARLMENKTLIKQEESNYKAAIMANTSLKDWQRQKLYRLMDQEHP